MFYCSEDNWYSWRYGSGDLLGRQPGNEELFTYYAKSRSPVRSFKEELCAAAASTLDHYAGLKPCIFFSGGVDSELILRSYVNIGANPEVYIVRYENNLNIYDVSFAVVVCEQLGVKYKIVDFNLLSFYENDAEQISEIAQIDRPRMLPHLKFTDCADGLIIVGHSDIAWQRPHDDYSVKTEWDAIDFEHDLGCDKYNMAVGRQAIYQWWKWTPGLVLSYIRLEWFQNLINDMIPGKLGINSSKIIGFREAYPDLIDRKKMTGFEKIDSVINEVEASLKEKYSGTLPFRKAVYRPYSQLVNEITC